MKTDHRVLLSILAVLTGSLAIVLAAPSSDNDFDDVFYDQRQNGSENFRIHLNDVMVVVAPAEALLSVAASSSDFLSPPGSGSSSSNNGVSGGTDLVAEDPDKLNKECKPGVKGKCNKQNSTGASSSTKRSRLRLSNLLMPFINRAHH